MPSPFPVLRSCTAAAALVAFALTATAAAPVPVGKRALLSLNIQIDGAGQRASKSDGVDVRWTTHRVLDAKVELLAAKAKGTTAADVKGQVAAARGPSADLAALQEQAGKCKEGDVACQMEIAMKMMDTDDAKRLMAESTAAANAPPRYQAWMTPPKRGRAEVQVEYQEQWDGAFLTASREVRNCRIALPATLTGKDQQNLREGVKGLGVEVDTQTGRNSLLLAIGSFVAGELTCAINDGGRVSNERENRSLTFNPPIDLDGTGGWIKGGAAAGTAIARGEMSFESKAEARSLTGMMSVTAPLKVKIRWELAPL